VNDTFDPEAGSAYIYVGSGSVASTREVDEDRLVDLTSTGEVVGIEFLNAGKGIYVQGLSVPAALLGFRVRQLGLAVLDYAPTVSRLTVADVHTHGVYSHKRGTSPVVMHSIHRDTWPDHIVQVDGSPIRMYGQVSPPEFSTVGQK